MYKVQHKSLVDPQKVYLPPIHIKLGLIKNFVKPMDHEGKGFQYLRRLVQRKLMQAQGRHIHWISDPRDDV